MHCIGHCIGFSPTYIYIPKLEKLAWKLGKLIIYIYANTASNTASNTVSIQLNTVTHVLERKNAEFEGWQGWGGRGALHLSTNV